MFRCGCEAIYCSSAVGEGESSCSKEKAEAGGQKG